MAIDERPFTTRARFRADLLDALEGEIAKVKQDVAAPGEWDGVPVVTAKDLADVFATIFGTELPPPDESSAEVRTPATVLVSAECPRCFIPQTIAMTVGPELRVNADGSELRLRAKAKAVSHVCGQLPLPVADVDQGSFALEDIVGGGGNDNESTAGPRDESGAGEECVGANHVPGCHHFDQAPPEDPDDDLLPA
jgi:hypothetical protein